MSANQPRSETTGRVVMFRTRASLRRGAAQGSAARASDPPEQKAVVDDLAKYEQVHMADDYRQRMIVNVIAFVFVLMLTGAGIWLADSIAALRKNEDCVLSGRRNCAPIDLRTFDR